MRLVSTVTPVVPSDLGSYHLDALSLEPCGGTPEDTACLLVRYFRYQDQVVEGDNVFDTLAEALEYAEAIYSVGRLCWRSDPCSELSNTDEIFKQALRIHSEFLRAADKGGFAESTNPADAFRRR